jgi:hypothetical protein
MAEEEIPMTARQAELFPKPPRKMRGQLMHVSDAYNTSGLKCQFRCRKCGHQTGWVECDTVTEAKKGLPCPKCNKD